MEFKSKDDKNLLTAVALLGLFALVIAALALTGKLNPLATECWEIFKSRESLRTYLEGWGSLAPLVFMAVQSFQVVFAPIPGELTGAVGGFVFGAVPNILYSTIGLTVGSLLAFTAARVIGMPLVRLVVQKEILDKFCFLAETRGTSLAFILFMIPGFPKDFLSYILGLSPMGFVSFAFVSTIGRIPGTIMLSLSGSAVYNEDWSSLAIIAVVTAVSVGGFLVFRERIEMWLENKKKQFCRTELIREKSSISE